MSSKDLGSYEPSSSTIGTLKDRETQTSQVYNLISNSSNSRTSRPLPQNIENKTSKDGKVKVFEFCEVIQDPEDPDSVSVIRETFSEEIISSRPKGSLFEKPTLNKYKYCKEVTQPYSQTFCTECPSHVTPPKKVAEKPEEPDCQSSKPEPEQSNEVYSCDKPVEQRINTCVSAMDADSKCKMHCKTTFINPEDKKSCKKDQCPNPCPEKTCEPKCPTPKCPSQEKVERKSSCEKPKPSCERCDQVDETKLKCCITTCIKESVKAVKKGGARCANEIEKAIGIQHGEGCDDKPTYYLLEKPRCPSHTGSQESSTCLPPKSSAQKFLDTQTQTVATIQCALKDFVGTVCNKTKDVIEVLKTESCKFINTKSEEGGKDGKTKDCSNSNSLSSIPKKIKAQIDNIDMSTGSESLERILEPARGAIEKVASIVTSTATLLQESDFHKIADDVLDARFNKSSPYDKLDEERPREIAQDHEPNRNANMFTAIKTKLFSIFGQKESCNEIEDDDDDELSAEKYFDKYCDQ